MHIFIDESGSFVPVAGQPAVSLVGALILPSRNMAKVEKKYARLRNALPKERDEVKGRRLNETQVAEVIELLRKNEALLEIVAIDMNQLGPDDLSNHRAAQARGTTSGLTDRHHPNIRLQLEKVAAKIAALPDQLYAQSVAMFELIWRTCETSINYFGQRRPEELGKFCWCLDGKQQDRTTDWEDLWSTIVTFNLQSKSIREPMGMFEELDLRYFSRFEGPLPDWLPDPVGVPREVIGLDIKLLVNECFRYSSDSEPGLELCDVAVNAVRRALVGNLQRAGWQGLARLMIHRATHYIRMISLGDRPVERPLPYERVLLDGFTRGGRDMLAPRFRS